MARRASLRTGLFLLLASVWSGAILAGASCSGTGESGTTPATTEPEHVQAAELGRPDARLVVITDLQGYLEPCGCTSRPLGGIDRLAAEIGRVRSEGVPTVLVAAGDLLFSAGADHQGVVRPGAETQEIWKAEAIVGILEHLQLAAAVPGGLDLRFGPATFGALASQADFPLLASGVTVAVPAQLETEAGPLDAGPLDAGPLDAGPLDAGPLDAGPLDAGAVDAGSTPMTLRDHVIVSAGPLRVGILGVSDMAVSGLVDPSVTAPADLVAAAEQSARALRDEGADLVIALVRGARRDARRIATQIDGVDFVVEGGLDDNTPHVPSVTEHGVLLHAGRHGRDVVIVDLHRRPEPAPGWTDLGTWARESELTRLRAEITELRSRIAEWEHDPSVAAADLAEQRAHLSEMEGEARALVAAPHTDASGFVATLVELDPERPRDAAVTATMEAYNQRVNEHNRVAFADWLPTPPAEGQPSYVGSEACGGSCHATQLAWWRNTLHGHAYATLVERHKEFNLSCVGCHVTGYNRPGGSTVSHTESLQNVGCENCHGPGSQHVANPTDAVVNVHRDAEEGICLGCHTPEHSDRFDYASYRARMVVPGHGLPAP